MSANISTIQNGIVFLMAEWSGQAKWSYNRLKDFLENQKFAGLICVDLDRNPDIYDLPELSGKIHGNGEALVIKNGKIVFVTVLGKQKELIENRCQELFKAFSA